MARMIKITPEYIEECRTEFSKEFERAISNAKLTDGKLHFMKEFGKINQKAIVYFTELAWLKMTTLIREFSDEVAWHGTAYRLDSEEGENIYAIGDIFVYPQEVTGATVNTDQVAYQTWLMSQEDDVFNNLRFQGHSHVNMGVTPSGVDLTHQEQILDQLEDDMFYIFMIWNKRHDVNAKIYDFQKNLLFEASDVTIQVLDGKIGLEKFTQDAKSMVKRKQYNYSGYQGQNYQGYGNAGYGRSSVYTPQNYSGPYNPVSGQSGAKKDESKKNESKPSKKDKKKDKKKSKMDDGWKNKNLAIANACDEQMTIYDAAGNLYDPTDPYGYMENPCFIT